MKAIYTFVILLLPFSVLANSYTGCILENEVNSGYITLQSGDAIGQSFQACSDGFLSHFQISTLDIPSPQKAAVINIYEVVNNDFLFVHQKTEVLPEKITKGEITFWIRARVPVFKGREYAVEILNLSNSEYKVKYNAEETYIFGSLIKNGDFSFSDLSFEIGIKDNIKPISKVVKEISKENIETTPNHELFQSWSNKNLELSYGDIGQEFTVCEDKLIESLGIKIKNIKSTCHGTLEFYESGIQMTNLTHRQSIKFETVRGEHWKTIKLNKNLKLSSGKRYFFSFKFSNPNDAVKIFYSTADPYKNGDMYMSDLSMNSCDLSFFLEEKGDEYLKEIEWLEENNYEQLEESPLAKKIAIENTFEVSTFPNPFDGQFMFSFQDFTAGEVLVLAITNTSGTLLWKNEFLIESSEGVITVNPDINFITGKYTLKVGHNGQFVNKTIVSK